LANITDIHIKVRRFRVNRFIATIMVASLIMTNDR